MDACEVQWHLVLHLFQDLARRELEKSDMTHKFAVSAASKGLLWDVGLILLAGMIASDVEQDVLSFSAAIASCQKRWKAGLEVLSYMSSKMVQKDAVTLSYAVTACAKGGFYLAEFDTLQALVLRLLQRGEASEGQRCQWPKTRLCSSRGAPERGGGEVSDVMLMLDAAIL